MSYRMKVYGLAALMFTIVAAGVLLVWAYMEIQHQVERERLTECIRTDSLADGQSPADQVIDSKSSTAKVKKAG